MTRAMDSACGVAAVSSAQSTKKVIAGFTESQRRPGRALIAQALYPVADNLSRNEAGSLVLGNGPALLTAVESGDRLPGSFRQFLNRYGVSTG